MRPALLWLAVADFLQFCSPQTINCTSTITPRGTHYSVPEFPASNCNHQWLNMTDYVLADKFGKMDKLVVNSSITEILLYNCFEEIKYRRSCPSERGTPTALCNMTCSGGVDPWNEEGTPLSKTHTIIIIAVLIPLLIAILFFIFISRCLKNPYATVNQNNQHAIDEDVERRL